MNKINLSRKFIFIALGAIVVIIAIVVGFSLFHNNGSPAQSGTSMENATTSIDNGSPSNPSDNRNLMGQSSSPKAASSHNAPPAPFVVKLITPVPEDQWTIGKSNPVSWDKEAGVTGEIDLLDAKTKNLVGAILSEAGAHQTSYSWDTRQVYLARYNPLKKDVVPGTYVIRLKFDGNNLQNILSGVITIAN